MAFVDTEIRLSPAELTVCCGFVPQLQGHRVDTNPGHKAQCQLSPA